MGISQFVASRTSWTLSARSSGPSQSGWRAGERWSMPGGQGSHLRHLVGHLLSQQVPAQAHLASLADEELAAVGEAQVMGVEAVAGLDALVEPLRRVAALVRNHAALARAGGGARHRRPARERGLRLVAQRPEAHAGDVDGDVELERALRARPEHRLRQALLPVTLR